MADEKVYTITVNEHERAMLMYALGAASGMFYDGSRRHDDADNRAFREYFKLAKKLGMTKPAGPEV